MSIPSFTSLTSAQNALLSAPVADAELSSADNTPALQGRANRLLALENQFQTPKDEFTNVKQEQLSQRRFPDWFVLTTLSQSFQNLAVNGLIPLSAIEQLRNQLHQQQRYREARVAHQLIQYKKVLLNSGTPWQHKRFESLPDGYSWPDIQWMLGKVQAGQDIDDIVNRYYERKSREAIYRANWAEIINVPLTLLVGAIGAGSFTYFQKLLKSKSIRNLPKL